MSVANSGDIQLLLGPRPRDARDPRGRWDVTVPVTGDASGDEATIALTVPIQQKNRWVYNVEYVFLTTSSGRDMKWAINLDPVDLSIGFDLPTTVSRQPVWGSPVTIGPAAFDEAGLISEFKPPRFLILHTQDRNQTTAWQLLRCLAANPGVAETIVFGAGGYYWSTDARFTPGGPRFPGGD